LAPAESDRRSTYSSAIAGALINGEYTGASLSRKGKKKSVDENGLSEENKISNDAREASEDMQAAWRRSGGKMK